MKQQVLNELLKKKDFTWEELIQYRSRRKLSKDALHLLCGSYQYLTGMIGASVNYYWLAESMSEAIEAAEALGL